MKISIFFLVDSLGLFFCNCVVQFQIIVLCSTLLQKLTRICIDCDIWMFHIHKSSLFTSLLNFLSFCLKQGKAPEVCQAILQLLLSLSAFDAVCGNLLSVGIVETLCLPLATLDFFATSETVAHTHNSKYKVESHCI